MVLCAESRVDRSTGGAQSSSQKPGEEKYASSNIDIASGYSKMAYVNKTFGEGAMRCLSQK